MRYIDNGHGDPREDALFPWLRNVLTADVIGIRWQSGFFEAGVLGVFSQTFERLAREHLDAVVLIGSNDGETQSAAVRELVGVLGLPRPNALLGVVSYADGFYHPKTIHLCYCGGRQAAYVGSSNLTSRGINGLNVEAGIILDTDEGDPTDVLDRIKSAIHEWFVLRPEGLFRVENEDDVDRLQESGILTVERPARPRRGEGGQPGGDRLPRRVRRHPLPPLPDRGDEESDDADEMHPNEPEVEKLVLIAELPGGQRWSQAAFPKRFTKNFFQVEESTDDRLRLLPVTQDKGVDPEVRVPCRSKGSHNWYYELGLAAACGDYPPPPRKPIGVFHRIAHRSCRYTVLMPGDASYPAVSDCLESNLHDRRGNELRRATVAPQVLQDAWPDNWFFEV